MEGHPHYINSNHIDVSNLVIVCHGRTHTHYINSNHIDVSNLVIVCQARTYTLYQL